MTLPVSAARGDAPERALKSNLSPVRGLKPVHKPSTPAQKKLMHACQEFESVMLGMMLKQMRATVKSSDPLEKGAANETYRGMLDDEMAKGMAKGHGMGLADGIYRQLQDTV